MTQAQLDGLQRGREALRIKREVERRARAEALLAGLPEEPELPAELEDCDNPHLALMRRVNSYEKASQARSGPERRMWEWAQGRPMEFQNKLTALEMEWARSKGKASAGPGGSVEPAAGAPLEKDEGLERQLAVLDKWLEEHAEPR